MMAKFCRLGGKDLPSLWQSFAIGMAKYAYQLIKTNYLALG